MNNTQIFCTAIIAIILVSIVAHRASMRKDTKIELNALGILNLKISH